MKRPALILLLLLIAPALRAAASELTPAEIAGGWLLLHDGESHFGWLPATGSGWSAGGGLLAMDGNSAGLLRSNTPFGDFLLRFEVKAYAPNSSAGLVVRAGRDGNPEETGYEIQLGGGDPQWSFGSVMGQSKAGGSFPLESWIPMEVEVNGGSITVRNGERTVVTASGLLGQAGLIEWEARRGGRLEIRHVRLKLLNPQILFNGTDLAGWKSTGAQPKAGGGILGLGKVFGGRGKPKGATWTAAAGQIHGEEGPGQLESTAPYADFIFQADVRINAKKNENKRRYGLLMRGDPGQFGTGYEVSLQPGWMGGVGALGAARKPMGAAGQFAVVTVAAFNRHFQVWVDGQPVTDANDVRPEGTNPARDARVTPGVIAFWCEEDGSNIDVRNVRLAQFPKLLGHLQPKKSEPATTLPPPPVQASAPAAPAAPSAPSAPPGYDAQMKAMQEQLQQQKLDKLKENEKKDKVAALLQQGLRSENPREQVVLFDQILALDPNNQVAFNARRESQAKIDAENAKASQEAQKKAKDDAEIAGKQQAFASNLDLAQTAFLAGNLMASNQALSAAERAYPDDPRVKDLRVRLDAARNRFATMAAMAAAGAGVLLLGVLGWMAGRRRKKDPYIEIVEGLDKGKKFNIDQEVVRLGAVPGDGGIKNEIVLRDAERMVSRFHAEVHFKQGKLYVIDNGSSNGTFVDKKRIAAGKPQLLKNGSRVSFGGACTIRIGFEKRSKGKKG